MRLACRLNASLINPNGSKFKLPAGDAESVSAFPPTARQGEIGKRAGVLGKHGQVVRDLLALDVRQGPNLVERAVFQLAMGATAAKQCNCQQKWAR